jgi:hypothetical protein
MTMGKTRSKGRKVAAEWGYRYVNPDGPEDGKILFVADGISAGKNFGTFFRKPTGNLKRVRSPHLPMRANRAEAQDDLDRYAIDHKLTMCCRLCGCTDEEACPEGCEWVAAGFCSACAEKDGE